MSENKAVRTRVAPSPTGDPHIGTTYVALFNYAFAKSRGGTFVLRIEDTDQARSTERSERAIYDALGWIGIPWDEGPEKGGPHGPYRQSERTGIYRDHARMLVDAGHAYPCFCTAERLAALRKEQLAAKTSVGYDGLCTRLSAEEAARRAAAGEAHVIRMRVPDEGGCTFTDRLRGEISIPYENVDQQVLVKSDGFPTYHLANVVDDHLMGITHVIRGEEWINSAPKHLLLYGYFGWQAPELIHLPLLRNPDRSKLSKRKNPTSVFYYRDAGYLPEALLNYLGQMAYTLPDGREMFSIDELVSTFDIDRISLGGPIFDVQKFRALNGRYLRERMTPEEILGRMKTWRLTDETWVRILPLVQKRMTTFADVVPMAAYLFADEADYEAEALISKKMDGEQTARLMRITRWQLEGLEAWEKDHLHGCFTRVAETEEVKLRDLLMPFYVALAGSTVALPLFESLEIVGRDLFLRRLHTAQERLGDAGHAVKGKKLKKLESYYREAYTT